MKVPILLYHKIDHVAPGSRYPGNYVTPRQFDAQLALLKLLAYRSISFADYLRYRRGDGRLPRRSVIITFDDGYRSNRAVALPILERHGFRATIFLVAGRLGETNTWDADELQEPLLDLAEVRAMQARGMEFESHTMTHPRLTRLAPAAVLDELRSSRERLAQLLGRPVEVLCYPYGDYNEETKRLAREAGYQAAVVIRRRMNTDGADLFALRRIPVKYSTSLARFAWDLFRLRWFHGSG
jgi:peptidoglycan/xylan/chitin deacetylase (PgdA/CDA1 family)